MRKALRLPAIKNSPISPTQIGEYSSPRRISNMRLAITQVFSSTGTVSLPTFTHHSSFAAGALANHSVYPSTVQYSTSEPWQGEQEKGFSCRHTIKRKLGWRAAFFQSVIITIVNTTATAWHQNLRKRLDYAIAVVFTNAIQLWVRWSEEAGYGSWLESQGFLWDNGVQRPIKVFITSPHRQLQNASNLQCVTNLKYFLSKLFDVMVNILAL